MIVELTAAAESDLERIGDFIAAESPARAVSFISELRETCMRLAEAPRGFPLIARYEKSGVRRRVSGNYLVFYRIDGERIVVLHILHGAMDYEPLIFPKP